MKKEEIQAWDWQRILFGQAPAEFLLEVLIRTIVIYLLLMVVLRLLGKRMDGQLTLTEMAVMVTLGAIVSVPMQMPERGLLVGVVALICVMIFQRGLNWLNVKNAEVEEMTQGTLSILVKDGIIQTDQLQRAGLSRQHLFSALRQKKIYSLGKVKRVYFEACGLVNVYSEKEKKSGLPIFPFHETELMEGSTEADESKVACVICGNTTNSMNDNHPCKNCGSKQWMQAIY
jgi:uncharacterized membrane protein YcaP (DUF421 family)